MTPYLAAFGRHPPVSGEGWSLLASRASFRGSTQSDAMRSPDHRPRWLSLGRIGHHLVGRADIGFRLRHVIGDAGVGLYHRRLLIGRQADQLTAIFHPAVARFVVEID